MEYTLQGTIFCFCFILTCMRVKLSLGEISCVFNDGSMCSGWTFEQNSTIYAANWTIWKGATLTANTGPQRDHLKKDGFYIFMETTNNKHRDIAMFYSPIIEQTDQVVNVTFWYYMHGIFIQSLKVYVFPGNGDQQLVISINNEQGKQWKQAVAYLEHMGPFKIGFQAMVGSAVSDIAVDDITITGAEIYPRSTTIETSTSLNKEKRLNENETEDFFPLPYIIICVIGGVLWLVILFLLCCCVHHASRLQNSKRTVGCNTSPRIYSNDQVGGKQNTLLEDNDVTTLDKVELTLDPLQLLSHHYEIILDKCETKL
ncbi:MAM and LDL-receptor class A domain-containing protein 1-like [Mytilus trossulus]|uniref:MAM and LDL-receptor class A domain-containing protein 1-like n=1 Tax=Mytilus trossulus TaxID=6551 RepID=UPI00300627DB